jgi:hypothetical protein
VGATTEGVTCSFIGRRRRVSCVRSDAAKFIHCMYPQHTQADTHKLLLLHTRAFAVCTHVYASMYSSIQAIQALDEHCHQCHRPNGIAVVFFPHWLLILKKVAMPRKITKSVARNLKHAVLGEAVIPKKIPFVWILFKATFFFLLN